MIQHGLKRKPATKLAFTCLGLEVLRPVVGFRYWCWIQLIDATL